ncbi:MAG: hypothetical protein OHK0028_05590 [Deltaproteobacteria bacterium]
MDPSLRSDHRGASPRCRAGRTLSAVLAAFFLVLLPCFSLSPAANAEDGKAPTFEERKEAEKSSRSRYRDLEVASLVIILVAGGAAILWAVRRRKP